MADEVATGYYWVRISGDNVAPGTPAFIAWREYGTWWEKRHPCSADSPIWHGFNVEAVSERLTPPKPPAIPELAERDPG
jgi:hypothetical protein